ncbi:MAG: methionine biosynthesis protein MetW [Candidatus Omnitrophica bacterium]|nr:methionine biosynthesis protein MetW [Candidatus Omnitrophota bacterium]
MEKIRADHKIILEIIKDGSTVLDLGCGKGELLSILSEKRHIRGQGIEIDQNAIAECLRRGVNVLHGDLDQGLSEYPDKSFDYVILNDSLPEVRHPETILSEALRVGKQVLVGFPNFCNLKARFQFGILGRAPVTGSLPHQWYDTHNLHFLSVEDFTVFCRDKRIKVLASYHLAGERRIHIFRNLLANFSLFLIT